MTVCKILPQIIYGSKIVEVWVSVNVVTKAKIVSLISVCLYVYKTVTPCKSRRSW